MVWQRFDSVKILTHWRRVRTNTRRDALTIRKRSADWTSGENERIPLLLWDCRLKISNKSITGKKKESICRGNGWSWEWKEKKRECKGVKDCNGTMLINHKILTKIDIFRQSSCKAFRMANNRITFFNTNQNSTVNCDYIKCVRKKILVMRIHCQGQMVK